MDEFEYLTWNDEEAVGVISIHNADSGIGVINMRTAYGNFFIKRRIECCEDFLKIVGEVARRTDSHYGSITILNIVYF